MVSRHLKGNQNLTGRPGSTWLQFQFSEYSYSIDKLLEQISEAGGIKSN